MSGMVLSLCDRTGVMVEPWLEAGWDAVIVDLQHPPGVHVDGRLTRLGGDVADLRLKSGDLPDIVFAFPPCTHLAASGARWMRDKGLPKLIEALTTVEACRAICEASGAPYMIENPVGTLSTYWREPDFRFDPYEFGGYIEGGADAYTKRTCLWIGNGFQIPPKRRVEPTEGSKFHLTPPGPDRADLRSVTPRGFARAVFEANSVRLAA